MFGGAFNPPTRAHIDLARYAMQETGAEAVIFVPTKMNYISEDQGKNYAFTNEERLEMLRKTAENNPWMEVSDFEIISGKQPRSYETLCHLRDEGWQCRLLFGTDKLCELENGWKFIDRITEEFGIVCMERADDNAAEIIENDPYLKTLAPYITIVKTPESYHGISSTAVRKILSEISEKKGEVREMIPEEIYDILHV